MGEMMLPFIDSDLLYRGKVPFKAGLTIYIVLH